MAVFPQLATGALTMLPARRECVRRTVVNELPGGACVKYSDTDGARMVWRLEMSGMTRAEWLALDELVLSSEGSLTPFTMLDPFGNLLRYSEEFGESVWTRGSMQLTSGRLDPVETHRATLVVNAGQVAQVLWQDCGGPTGYSYCHSVWARSDSGSSLVLAGHAMTVGVTWERLSAASNSPVFAVELGAGGTVELFGAQVEPQPAVSDYKRSGSSSGLYTNARFARDSFSVTARAEDVFDALVEVVA